MPFEKNRQAVMGIVIKAILFLLFSFRLVDDCGAFNFQKDIIEVGVDDSEAKAEKNKGKENSKATEDEKLFVGQKWLSFSNSATSISSVSPTDHDPYNLFPNQPITPPPDLY